MGANLERNGRNGATSPYTDDLLKAASTEAGPGTRAMSQAYRELSAGYRQGSATPDAGRLSDDQVAAYLAARLPATLTVVRAVLSELAERRADWQPRSLLDLGAGPGTASWAAAATFPSLRQLTLIERSPEMTAIGTRLAGRAAAPALREAEWRRASVTEAPPRSADLVIASYVLGELSEPDVDATVDHWWTATTGELVVIEPGTPRGFGNVLRVRDRLLAAGATITAPCPADAACPMRDGDWCHFGRRVARTAAHRSVKSGDLGFEDEKYSYVIASRRPPAHAVARVLTSPQLRSGHVRLRVCEAPEARELVIARSRGVAYRWARRAGWGDAVPPGITD